MKPSWSLLVAALMAAALSAACVSALTSVKKQTASGSAADRLKGLDASKATAAAKDSSKVGKDRAATDIPPPPFPDSSKSVASSSDFSQRAEINQSALDFAENVPKVKAVKTCYSKLYGGWNLFLYVVKGKKIELQQYQWNPKSKEWDIVLRDEKLPQDQIDYHIKSEVNDEKCFVLKDEHESPKSR
jgi:hypothetical protein